MYQSKNNSKSIALCGPRAEKKWLWSMMLVIMLFMVITTVEANNAVQQELLGLMDDVQAVEPDADKESYLSHADDLLDQQRFGQALSYYTKVIRLDRSVDKAFLGRSIAYSAVGKMEESIADLNVFILRNPEHSMAHVYRGVRYMSQGAIEYAEENLLKAIELNPKNAQAFDDLGVLYAQQGELQIAMQLFGQALRIDPYNEMAYHNLAIGYYLLDENEKALKSVDRALQLSPEARDSYILKAQILDAMGKTEEARKVRHYAQYLDDASRIESVSVN